MPRPWIILILWVVSSSSQKRRSSRIAGFWQQVRWRWYLMKWALSPSTTVVVFGRVSPFAFRRYLSLSLYRGYKISIVPKSEVIVFACPVNIAYDTGPRISSIKLLSTTDNFFLKKSSTWHVQKCDWKTSRPTRCWVVKHDIYLMKLTKIQLGLLSNDKRAGYTIYI